jgi:NADPH:quinone reductase-like Zn-dependent oxidoreductase
MYALQLNEFGPPSNLKYVEVKTPTLGSEYQVIVKVIAAGVNPIEYKLRRGNFPLIKALLKFPTILGNDFSVNTFFFFLHGNFFILIHYFNSF